MRLARQMEKFSPHHGTQEVLEKLSTKSCQKTDEGLFAHPTNALNTFSHSRAGDSAENPLLSMTCHGV